MVTRLTNNTPSYLFRNTYIFKINYRQRTIELVHYKIITDPGNFLNLRELA